MALAPIDDEHVAKDHPAAEPVLTPHTALHVARARLVATGEPAAVVFQRAGPPTGSGACADPVPPPTAATGPMPRPGADQDVP